MKNIKYFLLLNALIFCGVLAVNKDKEILSEETGWEVIEKKQNINLEDYPYHSYLQRLNNFMENLPGKDSSSRIQALKDEVKLTIDGMRAVVFNFTPIDKNWRSGIPYDKNNPNSKGPNGKTSLQTATEYLNEYKARRAQKATSLEKIKFGTYDTDPVVSAWNEIIDWLKKAESLELINIS